MMKLFVIAMAVFSRLFPGRAGRLALDMMTTPRRFAPDAGAGVVPPERIVPVGSRARLLVWPGGPRRVLLVHGWSGHAQQFQPLMTELGRDRHTFYALQMPGHGAEMDGAAHVGDFIISIRQALDEIGEPLDLAVGHSMGAAALAFVLAERKDVPRAILVAPPTNFRAMVSRMAVFLRFGSSARQHLLEGMANRVGIGYEVLDIARRGRRISCPVLLVHDMTDREVPFADTLRLHQAVAKAQLFQTSGLGHRRLLAEPSVLKAIHGFADEPVTEVRASA
ncbi:alpha/beta hydrolase [Alcanivorax sp.]|uniref:alpha/beta hydrolase n=1 Tax=Alcanivorax sp. TaxID=1872427 RepID=UPI002B26ECFE|nr:alpha/beta fold hydrolase [Alcanivorax sp.]